MNSMERDFILCAPCSWSLFFRTITPKECSTIVFFYVWGDSVKTAHLCAWKGTPTLHNIKLAGYSVNVTLNENVI